jgi:DNA-directed RNA polymerase specialized sigma24 family protein
VGRTDDGQGLAPAYQLALDLEAAGLDEATIAERLGLPTQAVPSLLALARTKAGRTRRQPDE